MVAAISLIPSQVFFHIGKKDIGKTSRLVAMYKNTLHINKDFVSYMGFKHKSACSCTYTFEMPLITPSVSLMLQYCIHGCRLVGPAQGYNTNSGMIDYE